MCRLFALLILYFLLVGAERPQAAEPYADGRPIRLIVPYPRAATPMGWLG